MTLFQNKNILRQYIGSGDETEFTVPNHITKIKDSAFSGCETLEKIILPDGLKEIGSHAFYRCANLKSINIPDSVTFIGESAFAECHQLTELHIPEGLTVLEKGICQNSGLHSLYLPDSVKIIRESAFYRCSELAEISMPDSVETIAFLGFGWWNDILLTIRRTYKDVHLHINVPIRGHTMESHLADFIQQPSREKFILLKPEYKIPLAVGYYDLNLQAEGYFSVYLKRSIRKAVTLAVQWNDKTLLRDLLDTGFVTRKNIDFMIQYAIQHTQKGGSPECQLMLTDYKYQHFPSDTSQITRKLKL